MDASHDPTSKIRSEPGYALGFGLIIFLALLLAGALYMGAATGPLHAGVGTTLLGLYTMAWGCMFLASYYFAPKTFFLRGLLWVCEHWSHPAGRGMAFFYFALSICVGGAAFLAGLGFL